MSIPYAVIRGDGQPQGVWGHRQWLTEPRPEVAVEGSAEWLRSEMSERNLTVSQLAKQLCVSKDTVIGWRCGRATPIPVARILDALSAWPLHDDTQMRDGNGRRIGRGGEALLDLEEPDLVEGGECHPHQAVAVINHQGISVQEAAHLARVSPGAITQWASRGISGEDGAWHYLPRVRVLDRQCILKSDLLEFMAKVGRVLRQDGGGGD